MTLANAAYLGIERFASDRNKENWSNATENDKQALNSRRVQAGAGQPVRDEERAPGGS